MIKLDDDCYIRLRLDELGAVKMLHLVSGLLSNEESVCAAMADSCSSIDGYTEWVSSSIPIISLGWDWTLDPIGMSAVLLRLESPRSNVMLVDSCGYDIGPSKTAVLLETVVDRIDWQGVVFGEIARRYAA